MQTTEFFIVKIIESERSFYLREGQKVEKRTEAEAFTSYAEASEAGILSGCPFFAIDKIIANLATRARGFETQDGSHTTWPTK